MTKPIVDSVSFRDLRPVALRMAIAACALLLVSGLDGADAQETISVRSGFWCPCNGDPSDIRPGCAVNALKAVLEAP